ncbi:IS3 family transposase [Kocuria sp. M1R5S2]|uniref:IS3 family transposase n=1 Tax=Kocuria rhizosphaerae TaxID=3376285 RepID=UPI0037A4B9BD
MSAPRKYDAATVDRAVRMYRERQDETGESKLESRRRIGELLGINQATLRNWIERSEVDAGTRVGVTSSDNEELKRLRKENAELKRANEILKTASAFFAGGGARPPHQVMIDYIDAYRGRFGVSPICSVLAAHGYRIAPSTYYAAKARGVSAAVLEEAYAAEAVYDLYRANRSLYGVRKLWHTARRAGLHLGRDQVGRLMRITGITGVVRGRHHTVTTVADERAPRHPDLIGRAWATPSRPDQWWVADFTYVWTWSGFVYVAFVTDVYSRAILGWQVTASKHTALVSTALQQALFTRRRTDVTFTSTGLVHHSDAGSQYTSLTFTEALLEAGIAGSIGTVGDALDNALMESTIGLYKNELIELNRRSWRTRAEVETETADWVHWYNAHRLHSAIGYRPPLEHEANYREHHQATAVAAA